MFPYALPIDEGKRIAQVVSEISSVSSPWHDGFHLISARTFCLTHVSCFFSPPINALGSEYGLQVPIGARQMAARLGSLLDSVECIALLGGSDNVSIFQLGKAI